MHPAEHRALRELGAFTGQLARHWDALAARLGGDEATLLRAGAADGRALLAGLEPLIADRGLAARPAAQLAGALVTPRPLPSDLLLEHNQALRFAVLDVQHCVTLLGYLERLATADGDTALGAFLGEWELRLRRHEDAVRAAAVAVGDRPDEAIEPADRSVAGRAGQRLSSSFGAVGEWVDGRITLRRR
jgi:hypothetical protein